MNNFQRIFIIRIRSKSPLKWYVRQPIATDHIEEARRFTMREAVEWIGNLSKREQSGYIIEYVPLVRDTRSEYDESTRMEARS
jgi:hypothetical protein